MLKLSNLLDSKRPSYGAEADIDSSQAYPSPQSSLSVTTSAPVSPAVSLFSAKGHTKFSSSVSSSISSPAMGMSMESSGSISGSMKTPLTDLQEEPIERESRELEDDYFKHFDDYLSTTHTEEISTIDPDEYDLTDTASHVPHSPKKRRAESMSPKGLSRSISTRLSTISARFKGRQGSDGTVSEDLFGDKILSRENSAASSIFSPAISPGTRIDVQNPPSPARTYFEERLSQSSVQPIDIGKANCQNIDESEPQATTPLLPPFMGSCPPHHQDSSAIHSPLQSPSVADVTEESTMSPILDSRLASLPSPPLSSKPSMVSISRPRTNTMRTVSGDLIMADPNDEWAHKLGHANFTVQPEPYIPEICDLESFQQLRADWEVARCNYAKHLVRTGEHYGVTSKIYKLTEEKWESIDREWKHNHEAVLAELDSHGGAGLGLTMSNLHPCETVKIPRLHDNEKFPELGDEEIVGPMTVAPAVRSPSTPRARSQRKRSFFKFLQDLVAKSYPSAVAATRS
ncbi:hypothetical protein DTO166G4_2619 [Paecilomyces variotii]|nr:hypothetical protein DTO166G4_2619 [Paecilomyces variotii]KAJ9240403.1 hypothetical protein DTO166G5_1741 [Paecilomyces variotii]